MPLVKCIRSCWDSQATKQYFMGDIADYPEDHVFLVGKIKCFERIKAEDLVKSNQQADVKVSQLAELLIKQGKDIEKLQQPIKTDELIPEEKRPVGRPPKTG